MPLSTPVNGGLSGVEFRGTRTEITLNVRGLQNTVALLLCEIQDLQDRTTKCPSKAQDPQDPAISFLFEIQDI